MTNRERQFLIARTSASAFYLIQGLIFATWASRIPDIKSLFQLSEATLGSVLFAIPVGQMIAMAPSAWLVGRFGSRWLAGIMSIVCPLCLVPIAFAPSAVAVSAILLLFGAAMNMVNISVNTQGVNIERKFDRNIMAGFHGLWSLGGFLGALLSMVVAYFDISLVAHFAGVAAISVAVSLTARRGLVGRDIRPNRPTESDNSKQGVLKRIDPFIILLGMIAFGAMVCEGTMYDWSGVYFAEVVKAPQDLIRMGYITCMCTMTIGRFMADRFVARFGAVRVVQASGLLIATGLLVAVASPSLIVASVGFFVVGFGISSSVPICYSMAGRSSTMAPATALAAVSTIGYFGFLLGPPVIGFVAHAISLRWTFGLIAVVGVAIAAIAKRLEQR